MIKLKSLLENINPWEMTSAERRNIHTAPERAYREGRPMAFSFNYFSVEPQVEGIVSTLHSLGIATNHSAGFSDAVGVMGASPKTGVSFESGKISPETLYKIKSYLNRVSKYSVVEDGNIYFEYNFPDKTKKLTTIDAFKPENVQPAIEIWKEVEQILRQDLPQ